MSNPVRDQFRPLFGSLLTELQQAGDWNQISRDEKASRLRLAVENEDRKYGRPKRFDAEFDYGHVVDSLALPDVC